MELHEMTDAQLSEAHAEFMAKAKAARADDDLDLAQRYLSIIRPMNVEMYNRIQLRRAA